MQQFLTDTDQFYGASMETVDFSQSAAATKLINDWVEAQTNGKIKDLIPPGFINANTLLVLVNAIYFKGSSAASERP